MSDIDLLDRIFLSYVEDSVRPRESGYRFSCDESVRVRCGELVGTVVALSNEDDMVMALVRWENAPRRLSQQMGCPPWVPLHELELA